MKFCIALVTYWEAHGFSTVDFRKSIDGTKAILHEQYAKVLIPNVENDLNVQCYVYPSAELDAILYGSEWYIPEE